MRLAIIAGNQTRHTRLAALLRNQGYDVQLFTQSKAEALNPCAFGVEHAHLLRAHQDNLARAEDEEWKNDDAELAQGPALVFRKISNLASEETLSLVENSRPDVIVTYGSGIIPDSWFGKFSGRIIGSHQGLPQYYRGSGSNFFAFIEGFACRMGVSLHLLDRGIDTGSIFYQSAPQPAMSETYYSYSAKLGRVTYQLFAKVLEHHASTGALPQGKSLVEFGKLFQRKDFTPETLELFFGKLDSDSFYNTHQRSSATHGLHLINA